MSSQLPFLVIYRKFIPPPNRLHTRRNFLIDLNEWDDAGIIAQVLAASQQEYFDTLKRSRELGAPNASGSGTPLPNADAGAPGPCGEGQD